MTQKARSGDPTLGALDADVVVQYDTAPPTAHLINRPVPGSAIYFYTACGPLTLTLTVSAVEASLWALPCPECFPAAPPPGCDYGPPGGTWFAVRHPGLDWQLA